MCPGQSAASIVGDIVAHLKEHGCPEHAAGVQWFFKEEVQSHGWYTAELRRYAKALHARLAADQALLLSRSATSRSGCSPARCSRRRRSP